MIAVGKKALGSISLGKGLSDGVNGNFCIDQWKGQSIWKEGIWDCCLRDTKTWMSMYHTAFFSSEGISSSTAALRTDRLSNFCSYFIYLFIYLFFFFSICARSTPRAQAHHIILHYSRVWGQLEQGVRLF